MKCSISGCPGQYEEREIVHTVKKGDQIIVFKDVPAEVCSVCGDTLLTPNTIRHLEKMLDSGKAPERQAPVYEYV